MATNITSPSGLHGLCSKEQLHLLDAIDSLRSEGINHYISLPQIIVCGDQSSGKSSVLEAISGVSFPVKSNMCTRFPTELVLRKTASSGVNVSIVPHHSRSAAEKESMAQFAGKLDDFKQLPNLIENAKVAMGIMALGKAFSNDLLRIEVSGPDRPHLTIVDLPGLIHSENKHQSAADVELIKGVVQGYMQEPRSIILAVVSAKNDYANQVVLKLARSADPTGKRTLGVITKPDALLPGSGSEQMYIDLAKNKDVEFHLGWHVLRNADSEAEAWTLGQRDTEEAKFFSSGNWAALASSMLGIQNLRSRLSSLLLQQISSELPNLINEIDAKSSICQEELNKLGQPRISVEQQRLFLMHISQSFQAIVGAAVDGSYTYAFFGDAMSSSGYRRRFRAVVQNLGVKFASDISTKGQKVHIGLTTGRTNQNPGDETATISRADYLEKVIQIMEKTRGRELPGMLNPMIIADLFREQSAPWEAIAWAHVQSTWIAAREFLKDAIHHVTDPNTSKKMWDLVLATRLDAVLVSLKAKTAALLKPHQDGHPITYNHYFTDTLQKIRLERQKGELTPVVQKFLDGLQSDIAQTRSYHVCISDAGRVENLVGQLINKTEPNMTHFAASEAIDALEAYYKVSHSATVLWFQSLIVLRSHSSVLSMILR